MFASGKTGLSFSGSYENMGPSRGAPAPKTSDLLLIFTRFPVPGKVKTRLIPAFGPEGAARLQFLMTRHLLQQVREMPPGVRVEVHHDGGTPGLMSALFGEDVNSVSQAGQGLGSRMARALRRGMTQGAGRIVLVGSDCPLIDVPILNRAFAELRSHDVVLGPAADGGYYLVGLNSRISGSRLGALFTGIDWGSDRVLVQTRHKAAEQGWTVAQVETLPDIDHPSDVSRVPQTVLSPRAASLSAVIPVLNEAANLGRALQSLSSGTEVEVLVVDGGSRDATVQVAERAGARVLFSQPGRGRQMNVGARAARGEIVFFLHGDSQAPFLYDWYIRQALSLAGVAGGSFSFGVDKPFAGARLIAAMTNVRSQWLGLPYGDQGLFVPKPLFLKCGGFRETPLLEDVHLVKAVKARGRVVTLPAPVLTSARRWTRLGPFQTTLINQIIMAGYLLRVPEPHLARLYGRLRALSRQRGQKPR